VLKATKHAIARLRCALLAKVYALPLSFHDRQEPGEIHGTIVQDTERLDVVANAALGQVLPAAIVALGLMGVALILDPLLFALLVVALPGMVMVKRSLSVTLRERTRTWREAFNRFSAQPSCRCERARSPRCGPPKSSSSSGGELRWRSSGLPAFRWRGVKVR